MTPVDLLESACADAWPPVVERSLGQWRLRAAGGYTGRANSVLAVGDPGMPCSVALRRVVAFAGERDIAPSAQVVVGSAVESDLVGAGWVVNTAHPRGSLVSVMVGSPRLPEAVAVDVADTPPPGWFDLAVGGEPTPAQRHVLTSGPCVAFATVHDGDHLVGIARGCAVRGWTHVSVVEVAPGSRRRGIGTALLAALARWGGGRVVLQVSVDNLGALALYERLGLVESHRYRYWVPSA